MRTDRSQAQPTYGRVVDPSQRFLNLDLLLDELADRIASRVLNEISRTERSPWMCMDAAIEYTQTPAGTFPKTAAEGRIPSHGSRRKLFHRAELDASLGYVDSGL